MNMNKNVPPITPPPPPGENNAPMVKKEIWFQLIFLTQKVNRIQLQKHKVILFIVIIQSVNVLLSFSFDMMIAKWNGEKWVS